MELMELFAQIRRSGSCDAWLSDLEIFLAERLKQHGAWPTSTDGIASCRVVVNEGARLDLRGDVWEIVEQQTHPFWLKMVRHSTSQGDTVEWSIYFDADLSDPGLSRRRRTDVTDPDQLDWQSRIDGGPLEEAMEATTHEGTRAT